MPISSSIYRILTFSPGVKYTQLGAALVSLIDTYGVFRQQDLSISDMHPYSWPAKVKYGLRGYEKVFRSEANNEIYYLCNIDREQGCFVDLRPGQHVTNRLKAVFVNGNWSYLKSQPHGRNSQLPDHHVNDRQSHAKPL